MGLQKTVPTWDKLFLSHESLCLKTSWDNFSELFCYFDHLLLMHHHQFSCTFHWSCLYLDHPLVIFKLQLSLSLSLSLSHSLSLDSISLTCNSATFPVHKEFIPYCCIHGCPKLQNPFSSLCVTFCSIWQFIGK